VSGVFAERAFSNNPSIRFKAASLETAAWVGKPPSPDRDVDDDRTQRSLKNQENSVSYHEMSVRPYNQMSFI
jgi:hypothetical protein